MRNIIRVELGKEPVRGKGSSSKPQPDWGLYNDEDYIRPRFEIWLRSGYSVYPQSGGMDDQYEDVLQDFMTLLIEHDYQYRLKDEWLGK